VTAVDIFTPELLAVDPDDVHRALASDGFWIFDHAIETKFAAALDDELGAHPLALNVNDVGPVRFYHQTYFTHALAASRPFFDLVTHPALRSFYRAHLGPQFRLKCQRYYQSGRHHELTWHTDDKTPTGMRTGVPGIGVVMYLRDTFEGELQVLARSNSWSGGGGRTEFYDHEIHAKHANDIVTISRPAGALILFDSRTLHRTRPITLAGYVRKSVFLQVDADMAHSEKIIVDTQFIDPHDDELLRYLGFGMPSGYPTMPPSGLATLNDADLRTIVSSSLRLMAARKTLGPAWRALLAAWRRVRPS